MNPTAFDSYLYLSSSIANDLNRKSITNNNIYHHQQQQQSQQQQEYYNINNSDNTLTIYQQQQQKQQQEEQQTNHLNLIENFDNNKVTTSTRDNSIYDIIIKQTVIQQCSNKFLLLTGYTPLEIIGRSFADFLYQDDLKCTYVEYYRFIKKDGSHLHLKCQKRSINNNKNNNQFHYFNIIEDNYEPHPSSSPYNSSTANFNSSFVLPKAIYPSSLINQYHPQHNSALSVFQLSSDFSTPIYCMNNNNMNNNNNNSNPIFSHHSIVPPSLAMVSASSKAYKKRKKMLQNYVCTDCGAQRSTEWRRGPFGPKTLCNACGLRWAKKNKKKNLNGN